MTADEMNMKFPTANVLMFWGDIQAAE